ncbi:MAG: hypothetical protein FWD32_02080 [Firmicutes bacterium]|nr:hypothetical protein [Bacillota bacterium]
MAKKSGLIKAMDGLPWIVKLILCIPVFNIVYAIYRIVKGVETKNILMLIVGILWIIPGVIFGWLIDLICVILYKKPTIFA